MSTSALLWFIALTTQGEATPEAAAKIGTLLQKMLDKAKRETADLRQALGSRYFRVQVGRLFRRQKINESLQVVRSWLVDDVGAAVAAKGCALTHSAWSESVQAFDSIIEGVPASNAWGLGHTRGAKTGFSRTLDAKALADYLTKAPDLAYSKTKAIEVASELFEVNPDEIRRYTGIEPMDDNSEAMLAFYALVSNDLLEAADRYFDTEELRDFKTDKV